VNSRTATAGHHVAVIGAGAGGRCVGSELLKAGIADFVILEQAHSGAVPSALEGRLRLRREVISSVFDDATDTWTVKTRGGEIWQARVVIAAHAPAHVPWIPDLVGRNDFRGASFHAAAWDRDFDPTGKHVAVIGADATAGRYIGQLTRSAASVIVLAHPPRRVIPQLPSATTRAKRWLRRHASPPRQSSAVTPQRRAPKVVRVAIEAVTASGIRTRDGVDHDVDAIIYGTGFTIHDQISDERLVGAEGLTIRQAWYDGMEPYLGVAVHGFPNYFLITRPDIEAQARYVSECLELMNRTASTRIEVRRSSQQVFNERVHLRRPRHHVVPSAFDVSPGEDAAYDGAATLTIADTRQDVRVRLTGYLDPIDGQYHWQGMVFDPLSADLLKQTRVVTLTVGDRSAPARITERTPQGSHSVVGVGVPPFAHDVVASGRESR
jgi:cation diffusion facilitator CzcD-associated flavoprotein CzcO